MSELHKVVELVYEDGKRLECGGQLILKGPIKDALLLLIPPEEIHLLNMADKLVKFADTAREVVKGAGYEGELFIMPSNLKFARFEPVDEGEQ